MIAFIKEQQIELASEFADDETTDLESVQLLQGQGSVLYGQGAVGGTINVVTKSPVFAPHSIDLYSSYGSFNTYEVGLGGGGQIGKQLAFRADYSYYASDGYVVHSNPHNLNATGSILYKVRDNLSARVSLDVLKDSLSSYYGTPYVPGSFGTSPFKACFIPAMERSWIPGCGTTTTT